MRASELFESPQNTFPTEFGLDDADNNTKVTKDWLTDKRKQPIEKFDNGRFTLYELPRAFLLVDHEDQYNPMLVYSMKFTLAFHKFIGRQCAQQIAVWRDPTVMLSKDMARHIFQNYLLPKFKAVITDAKQTADGQRFWDERIAESIMLGQHVFYVSLIPNREIIKISTITDYRNLKIHKEIWGDPTKHQARRIIISIDEIL